MEKPNGAICLVEPFREVIVQVRILDQRSRDCGVAKQLGLFNAAMPGLGSEMTLSNAHQYVEFRSAPP